MKHVRMVGEVLKENLPEIPDIIRETREDAKDCHGDAKIPDFSERFSKTIRKTEMELSERLDHFDTAVFMKKAAKVLTPLCQEILQR